MEQAAYLAGILDGEGSVILYKRRDRDSFGVLVSVTNSSKPLLDSILSDTRVGAVNRQKDADEKHKATWFWRCHAEAAESFLQQIRRYIRIKARQADIAIEFQEKLRDPALKADRGWQEAAREEMRRLNRRGPTA